MNRFYEFIILLTKKSNNRYWIATIAFVIITQVFSENKIWDRIQYNRQISRLESEIEKQEKKKLENQEELNEIGSTNEGLERFARERHRMIAPDEELFIIKK
jgi:cell division protein FtsB